MTKRALKRMVREGAFDAAQFEDDAKIRRLPYGAGLDADARIERRIASRAI